MVGLVSGDAREAISIETLEEIPRDQWPDISTLSTTVAPLEDVY